MPVTLYRGNRLDAAEEREPADVVDAFVEHVRSDAFERGRPSVTFAFRWWLAGQWSADEDALELLDCALVARLNNDLELKRELEDRVYGPDA